MRYALAYTSARSLCRSYRRLSAGNGGRWLCLALVVGWMTGGDWVGCSRAAADEPLQRFESTQQHMGTDFTLVFYTDDTKAANHAQQAAFARISELNSRLSDYLADSELSQLSRSAPHEVPVSVSDDLYQVVARSLRLSEWTDGAFDVTVGPITRLWRRARRSRRLPTASRLETALAAVGYQHIEIDPAEHAVRLTQPSMRLDLGGIAKGYALDAALAVLEQHGIRRAIVNGGGDLAAGDAPPASPGWKVALAPLDPRQEPSEFLYLRNAAMCTSGDAWQFVELGGKRYSHIVDPRTGLGLTRRSQVTVLARQGADADALASGISVLGPERGLELIDKLPGTWLRMIVVSPDGNVRQVRSNWSRTNQPPPPAPDDTR